MCLFSRGNLKATELVFCAKVKSSDSSRLGYHSEEGSEAESRPRGNKCGDCLLTSASLCCIYRLCTGPGSLSQDGSPDWGPFPRPDHAWRPRLGAGRVHKAGPPLADSLPGTRTLHSAVTTAPEPLIWVLLPHAQTLGHLSLVFLSEMTFILGPEQPG